MMTEQTFTPFTEAKVKEFTDKLMSWAAGVSVREQSILAALVADAGTRDVHGYGLSFGGGFSISPTPIGGTFGGGSHAATPVSSATGGTSGGSSGGTAGRATSLT